MDFIDDLDVSIIANILVNMGIDISNLNDITDADDYEDTISTITASLEKLRNEEDPLYVLLELIAGDNEELVDFFVHKAHLGLNPGHSFGRSLHGYMRLNVACPRATLEKAMQQLKEAVDGLKK